MPFVEKITIHQTKPKGFRAHIEVAAAYVEIDNNVLFLQRSDSERGLWGVPGGKIEQGESPDLAVKRELFEETGICLNQHSRIDYLGALYMRKPNVDYVYHTYSVDLAERPSIRLSPEHIQAGWYTHPQVFSLELMAGAAQAFAFYQQWSENKH